MGRYILKRLIISVPILLVITILIFGLLQITPGDPLDAYVPPDQTISQEQREAIRHELGLDQPAPVPGSPSHVATQNEPLTWPSGR